MNDTPRSLNIPNLLTIARILAIPVIVALVVTGVPFFRWIALALFAAAAITDFFDGFLARALGQISPIGRMLDPIADKLLVGALLLTFAWDQTFSLFDLVPAIAILLREIFVAGLREHLGTENVVLPVSRLAKYKTTIQLLALGILIAEPLLLGLRLISDAFLWGAALITIWTGGNYWAAARKSMKDSST
jgi:CDP-diacylglycerol--glycerol-3-phosphate 3-phosphatidyltransferase